MSPNSVCKKRKSQSKIPFVVHITFMFCGRPLLNKSSVRSTLFIPVIPSTLLTPPTALSMSSSSVDKPLSEHPSLTPLSVSVLLGESPFRLASSSAPFLGQLILHLSGVRGLESYLRCTLPNEKPTTIPCCKHSFSGNLLLVSHNPLQ